VVTLFEARMTSKFEPSLPYCLSRLSLRTKLIIAAVTLQSVLTAALLIAVLHVATTEVNRQLELRMFELERVLGGTLAEPVAQSDYATIYEILNGVTANDGIVAARVLDANGSPLASLGRVDSLASAPRTFSLESIDWNMENPSIESFASIIVSGKPYGQIQFSVSIAKQAEARSGLIRAFSVIAVLVGSFAALFSVLGGIYLTGRLQRLKVASDEMMRGQYDIRVPGNERDEIGDLGRAFAQLGKSVQERIVALTQAEAVQAQYLEIARTEHAKLNALLDSMHLGIVFLGPKGQTEYVNKSFSQIWSHYSPSFESDSMIRLPEQVLPDGKIVTRRREPVQRDDGVVLGTLWIFEDVTKERKNAQALKYLAERDPLTGLLNRRSFTHQLREAIQNNPTDQMILLSVDLDHFKAINDLKGHKHGDQELVELARKLIHNTRAADLVARVGGDQFVVLIHEASPEDQAEWSDRLIGQLMAKSIQAGGELHATCSVGVAVYPRDGSDAEAIIAAADSALEEAKRAGRNVWRGFTPQIDRSHDLLNTIRWAERTDWALRNDGFAVFLQGVFDSATRQLHHYEALIRMHDLENLGGFLSPGEFIVHAEASGKIQQIDRFMLRSCVRILSTEPDIAPIAVNISAQSFGSADLFAFIQAILLEFNVNADRLHLELTETSAVADAQTTQKIVRSLQELGCKVCLDDFGSGFSSLAYLKQLSADYIKIDGMFIRNLTEDRDNQTLLRAIVDIAHSSDRLVVAEWVEDEAALDLIRSYGVDLAQGYLLDKPRPFAVTLAERGNSLVHP
jgi:diguanylate cyclase (GGDEF)-like protein